MGDGVKSEHHIGKMGEKGVVKLLAYSNFSSDDTAEKLSRPVGRAAPEKTTLWLLNKSIVNLRFEQRRSIRQI